MAADRTGPGVFRGNAAQEQQQQPQNQQPQRIVSHSATTDPAHSSVPPQHVHATPPSGTSTLARLQVLTTRIPHNYITPFCGASAGVASGIVTCPLDVIKTKLQAQGGFQMRRNGQLVESGTLYRGMVGTGSMVWRDEGIRGLYKGLGPMLLGYLPTWAVYLTIYDRTRDYFFQRTGMGRFPVRLLLVLVPC